MLIYNNPSAAELCENGIDDLKAIGSNFCKTLDGVI